MALGQEIASFFVRIGADTGGMQRGLQQANTELKSFARGMGGLGALVGLGVGAAVAQVARMGVNMALELNKMAAMHDRLSTSFGALADQYGGDADRILASLKAASGGTVAETQLILASNRAMMLGLGADADKMGELMEVARFRGRAMGLTTAQAFSDIVTGIGRMSPLILDNLGIVINAEQRFGEYAKSIGKTAAALSDAEKKQVMLNSVLAEGQAQIQAAGGVTTDTADKFEMLGAKWEDLRTRLGKSIQASVIVDVLVGALDAIESGRGARTSLLTGDTLSDLTELESRLKMLQERQAGLKEGSLAWNMLQDDIDNTKRQVAALKSEFDEATSSAKNLIRAFREGEAAASTIRRGIQGPEGMSPQMQDWINEPTRSVVAGTPYSERDKIISGGVVLWDQTAADEAKDKQKKFFDEQQSAYKDRIAKIKGLMSATSVTELDMLETKFGMYRPKWDEYSRRMQAVIEGGESNEWAQKYFPGLGGDELKMRAMQAQQAFRSFDFSSLSGSEYSQMVQSIADEYRKYEAQMAGQERLASDVAKLLGVGGGAVADFMGVSKPEDTGKAYAQGALQGAKESGIAEPLATAWRDDITKNSESLTNVGKAAYKHVLTGVRAAIQESTSLVQLLAEATAPIVGNLLTREANRGGATP